MRKRSKLNRAGSSYLEVLEKYMKKEEKKRTLKQRGRFNETDKNGNVACDVKQIVKEHMKSVK